MKKHIYINNCGVVSPLGAGKEATAISLFSVTPTLHQKFPLFLGGEAIVGAVDVALPKISVDMKDLDCRNNRLMQIALTEIKPAIDKAIEKYGSDRVAVVMGTSTSGISNGENAFSVYYKEGKWPSEFSYTQQEISSLSAFVSRFCGVDGPSYVVATACSSSAKVFACARRLIRSNFADAVIVGGADTLCQMTVNGFNSLELLSKTTCNPFSKNRDGITIGEGAAAFLVSRDKSPVELIGVGETSDAHHLTAPDPTGDGAKKAMSQALEDAELIPSDIDYINMHGTASRFNDAMEAQAIFELFGAETACSSTKGLTGHMLGATGGVEAVFLWLMLNPMYNQTTLPVHVWDGQKDPDLPDLCFVTKNMSLSDKSLSAMLSNSFGFGGNNVSIIMKRSI